MEGDRQSALNKLTAKNKEMRTEQGKQRKQKALKFRLEFKQKLKAQGKKDWNPAKEMAAAEPEHPSIKRAGGLQKAIQHGRLNQSTDYGWENVLYESLTEAGVIFGKTHEKRFKKHIKAKRVKEAAKKKAAAKRARARQITIDSGDPEVAHMRDPANNPRRW